MLHISMRVEELEFYDELFQMVTSIAMDAVSTGKVHTRGLNSIDLFYMVVFPELLGANVKGEFNLKDHEATRYLHGTACQVVYHPWLRLKNNHITRSTNVTTDKESIFLIIHTDSSGEMQIETVGGVVLRDEKRFTELQEKSTVNTPPVTITDSKRPQHMRVMSSNKMKCCYTQCCLVDSCP